MATKQINARIDESLLSRLKYAAWFDRESITEAYEDAIKGKIEKWENKNGPITEEMIKKVEKK